MKTSYKHLTLEDREQFFVYEVQGLSLRDIAKKLGKHHTTLGREIKRNGFKRKKYNYQPYKAQQFAQTRKKRSPHKPRLKDPFTRQYVCLHLKLGWSPELIAGRLPLEHPGFSISYEAIYQFVYSEAKYLIPFLTRRYKRRRKKATRKPRPSPIPNRIEISKRSLPATHRLELGHWEADSVVSKASKTSLNVLVERKSRLTKMTKISQNTASCSSTVVIQRLKSQPQKARLSITYDNGSENYYHENVNRALKTKSYFCSPYHSWEKGSVENTIGLLRRFLPKKTDFQRVSSSDIRHIENLLNNRPKKCLNFRTPKEVYSQLLSPSTGALPP